MNDEVISFFEKFKCLAGECPDNCCRAWDMPLDEDTIEQYRQLKGKEGFWRRLTLRQSRDGQVILQTPFGRCCNLSKDKLCKLHAAGKMELMPKVCRLYPRNTVRYGEYKYGTLDLSCIVAARLLVETEGRANYVDAPDDMEIYWEIKDIYTDFVEDLRSDLDCVLDYLWGTDESLWSIERNIFAHVFAMHQRLVRDDIEGARGIPFSVEEIIEACGDDIPLILKQHLGEEEVYPFYPMGFMNELIYQNIPEDYLRRFHPRMKKMIDQYKTIFGNVSESDADRIFLELWQEICEKYDWIAPKMKSYFSYKLQMNYLNAAIDYYVLEPVLLAMINVQFLLILLITADRAGAALSVELLAELISENERLISHNKVFNSDVMKKARKELF